MQALGRGNLNKEVKNGSPRSQEAWNSVYRDKIVIDELASNMVEAGFEWGGIVEIRAKLEVKPSVGLNDEAPMELLRRLCCWVSSGRI